MSRLSRLGLMLAVQLPACHAYTDAAMQSWPTECVGRMQLQLPGAADTAAFSFNRMQDHYKVNSSILRRHVFPNNTPATFADGFAITHPLTAPEQERLKALATAAKARVARIDELDRKALGAATPYFGDLPSPPFDLATTIGWQFKERVAVSQFVGASMVQWSRDLSDVDSILHARPRRIFEVPREPGLCLPYVFAGDNGKLRRSLSMSYRLKDHPDIQVTLTDASAYGNYDSSSGMSEKEARHRNKMREPDPEIAGFWHMRLNAASLYESMWRLPSTTRPITLAGYEGRQSFVRLTMDDGTTKNYGYLAVVRGDPDAAEDTPDLRLYVQQDVTQAKGKTPLNKEQFIEMAQAIAKSVQRRPVSPN